MSELKRGVYKLQYSDQTESVCYWDGANWRLFGVTARCSDSEMGYKFLWPIDVNSTVKLDKQAQQ